MKLSKLFATAAAAAVLSVASSAFAATVVLNFNSVSGTDLTSQNVGNNFTVNANGYTFDITAGQLNVLDTDNSLAIGGPVTISYSGLGVFDLVSFKLSGMVGVNPVVFFSSAAGSFNATNSTIAPPSGAFTNLTSFTITPGGDNGSNAYLLDDITLEIHSLTTPPVGVDAVPLPSAAMSGSALLGLSMLRRRR